MKKRNLKTLALNKKSIADFSNAVKGQGLGAGADSVQNSWKKGVCSDTVQSFCNDDAAGSCNGCPVGTGTIQTNCCN